MYKNLDKNLDFSGQNHKGRSFKGKSLIGVNFKAANIQGADFRGANLRDADFRDADIRSANFTGATLIGANFTNAKAGLRQRWTIILIIVALSLSTLSGLCSAVAGAWSGYLLSSITSNQVAGLIIVTGSLFFITIICEQGLQEIPKALGITGSVVGILTIVGAIASNISLPVSVMAGLSGVVIATIAGIVTLALALAVITSTTIFVVWAGTLAGGMALALAVSIAMAGSVLGSVTVQIVAGSGSFSMTLAVGIVSTYIGKQTLAGKKKHTFLRDISNTFASIGGTSFCGADLTNVNFSNAILKGTNFNPTKRKQPTILVGVCWYKAEQLDHARVDTSILANPDVRNLLVTRNGYNKSYIEADFRSANLNEVNLENANLTWADLSYATLHHANLKNTKLIEALALDADFTGATFTGACLESWSINSNTKLEDVDCQHVFLLHDEKERRPHSGNFAPGDFAKLVKKSLETIDLIFREGLDWQAFASAFKQIEVQHEDAQLEVQSIENKGDGVVIVKIATAPNADKGEIHSSFMNGYELAAKALAAQYETRLQDKDTIINRLFDEVSKAMAEKSGDIITINQHGAVIGSTVAKAESGSKVEVTQNIFQGEKQSLAEAAAEIQRLLRQLEETNPTATESEQVSYINVATKPELKQRVIAALKAGGETAIDEFVLENKFLKVVKAVAKGWLEAYS